MNEPLRPNLESDYPVRHVAFLDILGFTNKIFRIGDDLERFTEIYNLQQTIRMLIKHAETPPPIGNWALFFKEVKATAFSDCITISTPADKPTLVNLVDTVLRVCRVLLSRGALTRGGISTGRLHHEESVLFGDAFIRAYHLERDVAKQPRIIIDSETMQMWNAAVSETLLSKNRDMIVRDNDGVHMLDLFHDSTKRQGLHVAFYRYSGEALQVMLNEPGSKLGDWAKMVWMAERFNAAVAHNGYAPAVTIPLHPVA